MNFFELSLRVNGFNISKAKRFLSELRCSPVPVQERLDFIVSFHRKNNPLYRELTGGRVFSSFEDLPVVSKRDFQRPLESILSDGYCRSDVYVSNTSGSSGIPFFFAKDRDCHALSHAIAMDRYAQYGITSDDKQARFYGIPMSGSARYKELLKDFLANRVRFPVFELSDRQLSVFLERFRRMGFGYIYGYTSAIVLFAQYVKRQRIVLKDVCPSLKCCIVTSEVCSREDRNLLRDVFGVEVVNEYGASETGIIAFTDVDGDWAITSEDLYVEVVDDANRPVEYGCTGKILISHLTNRAFPFIRYEIGDLGVLEKRGDKIILKELSGRVNDIIRLPSGGVSAGLTFYYVSRSILEHLGIVKEFIIRQTALDSFCFDVVSDRAFTHDEIAFLQGQMDVYLEPGLRLEINRVDCIERPPSGKIKHFYSEL